MQKYYFLTIIYKIFGQNPQNMYFCNDFKSIQRGTDIFPHVFGTLPLDSNQFHETN